MEKIDIDGHCINYARMCKNWFVGLEDWYGQRGGDIDDENKRKK